MRVRRKNEKDGGKNGVTQKRKQRRNISIYTKRERERERRKKEKERERWTKKWSNTKEKTEKK